MKYVKWILLTVCVACSFERYKMGRDAQDVLLGSPDCTPVDFSQVQSEIFGTPADSAGKCLSCHQVGGKLLALDSYAAVKSRLAQIEDSVRTNRMPKNGPLPADKKQLLYTWIAQGAPEFARDAVPVATCNTTTTPTDPADPVAIILEPHYESLRKEIFASKCLGCHDGSGIFSFYDFSTYESIIGYKKLFDLPSDGSDSRFVKSLVSGAMPKNGKPLAAEQIEVIRQWVALGLPKTAADVGSNINPEEPDNGTSQPSNPVNDCDLVDFNTVNAKVFQAKCTTCHDETMKVDLQSYAQIQSHLTSVQWMIKNDKMPPKKPLDKDLKDLVLKWIDQGAPETVTLPSHCEQQDSNPVVTPLKPLVPTYNSMREHFLEKKCIACHFGEKIEMRKDDTKKKKPDFSSYQVMVSQKWLFDFKKPHKSEIVDVIVDGEMPPASAGITKKLTQIELDTLIEWIQKGLPEG